MCVVVCLFVLTRVAIAAFNSQLDLSKQLHGDGICTRSEAASSSAWPRRSTPLHNPLSRYRCADRLGAMRDGQRLRPGGPAFGPYFSYHSKQWGSGLPRLIRRSTGKAARAPGATDTDFETLLLLYFAPGSETIGTEFRGARGVHEGVAT